MRLLIALFTLTFCLHAQAQKIEWMSFEAAIDAQAKADQPKKIFIDVYTDWCGWCKKMDKETFNNPEVAVYMQQHFYMVKLDGEGKKPIVFRGKTFSFVPSGRNGYHELAAGLMQGQLSYPTVVFLNEQAELLSPVPGYHPPESFMPIA
jgi:thioredoxin-related protein